MDIIDNQISLSEFHDNICMTTTNSVVIPKLIMQTWKTHELPDKWKATQSSIKKYMPDWNYILMTDEMNRAFIQTHFPDFIPYYDAFPYPIQRADAIRYAWLYIHGGLYLDCDFELLAPLDELFFDDRDLFLLASSNTPNVLTNAFMAAKPGNKVFTDMIEEMKLPPLFSYFERHLLVMNTTGPMSFNRVVKRSGQLYKQLPSAKLNPYTICDTVHDKPGTLLRPLEGSSWVSGTGVLWQWCYCSAKDGSMSYIIAASLIVGLFILIYFGFLFSM